MRVAFALGGTDRGKSGISRFVRSVLPVLRARLEGGAGSLVAFGRAEDLAAYQRELQAVECVETPRAPAAPGPNALWHLTRAGACARKLGADVLLLPAANRRLTFRARIATVAVVHDFAQMHVHAKFDRLRMIYARHVIVRALRSASELVAVSEATRRDLSAALACPPERIRVVQNGVDAARFSPPTAGDERVARARSALQLEGPYVLYTARLEHPGKNHVRLLQAFARSQASRTHRLVLAGADFGAAARLREEISRLAIGARVQLLGFVADELLPGLVAGADAIAMIGLYEGFGLPALEAAAAGRTVLAANSGALPEVIGPLAALCDALSVPSITDALDRALGDTALRHRAAAEGPGWAAARGWEASGAGLFAACKSAHAASHLFHSATRGVSA